MSTKTVYCQGDGPEFVRWLKKKIKTQGYGVVGVFPGDDGHWFAYTVGNHDAGLPEILLIGPPQGQVEGPIAKIVEIMRERKAAFGNGELVGLGGKYPGKAINVTCETVKDLYTCAVEGHYGTRDYAVQQMMIPDRDGRFPDEQDCAEPFVSFRVRYESGLVVPWACLDGQRAH